MEIWETKLKIYRENNFCVIVLSQYCLQICVDVKGGSTSSSAACSQFWSLSFRRTEKHIWACIFWVILMILCTCVSTGDSLTYHSEQKFLTFDLPEGNCARQFQGAFWYKTCHYANPNGAYLWGTHNLFRAVGVEWFHWKGYEYSLKAISMKIRPVQ